MLSPALNAHGTSPSIPSLLKWLNSSCPWDILSVWLQTLSQMK